MYQNDTFSESCRRGGSNAAIFDTATLCLLLWSNRAFEVVQGGVISYVTNGIPKGIDWRPERITYTPKSYPLVLPLVDRLERSMLHTLKKNTRELLRFTVLVFTAMYPRRFQFRRDRCICSLIPVFLLCLSEQQCSKTTHLPAILDFSRDASLCSTPNRRPDTTTPHLHDARQCCRATTAAGPALGNILST